MLKKVMKQLTIAKTLNEKLNLACFKHQSLTVNEKLKVENKDSHSPAINLVMLSTEILVSSVAVS
jgi:hypothetical protein